MSSENAKPGNFPVYPSFDAVRCIRCGGSVVGARDGGTPDGYGRYLAICVPCRITTWFDLGEREDGVASEQISPQAPAPSLSNAGGQSAAEGKYRIVVYDNYHYMDRDEAYEVQHWFGSAEDAIRYAKGVVEASVSDAYKPGITANVLWQQYRDFGESPQIFGDPPADFSAWDYAKEVCEAMCRAGAD